MPSRVGVIRAGRLLFGVLAVVGIAELSLAIGGPSWSAQVRYFTTYFGDDWGPLRSAYGFVHWLPPSHWYSPPDAHPLPHNLILFSLPALLPTAWARLVATIACVALLTYGLRLWAEPPSLRAPSVWPALVSAPVVVLIVIDQLQAAFGLAAISLAIGAQRNDRWTLAGAALALGMVRPGLGLPTAAMMVMTAWRRPDRLLLAGLGGALATGPALVASFVWDPHWVGHYLANLAAYPMEGPAGIVDRLWGPVGFAGLELGAIVVAALLARDSGHGPLDLDRASFALALTIVATPFQASYSAVPLTPALVRLGSRPHLGAASWLVSGAVWVAVIAGWPEALGSAAQRGALLAYLSVACVLFLVATYPLVRHAPSGGGAARGGGGSPRPCREDPAFSGGAPPAPQTEPCPPPGNPGWPPKRGNRRCPKGSGLGAGWPG